MSKHVFLGLTHFIPNDIIQSVPDKFKQQSISSIILIFKQFQMTVEVVDKKIPRKDVAKSNFDRHKVDPDRYSGAFFLIIVGTMLLMNTTGMLSWSVWLFLLKFWPIFIIIAGVKVVFGKSKIGAMSSGVITLIVYLVIAVIAILATGVNYKDREIVKPVWSDRINTVFMKDPGDLLSMTETYGDVENFESVELDVDLGIGKFTLIDGESDDFLTLDSKYYDNLGKPEVKSEQTESALNWKFSQQKDTGFVGIRSKTPEYSLQLSQDKAIETLSFQVGAGEGKVDLDSTSLDGLSLDVGAGRFELKLSETSLTQSISDIKIGTGEVRIYIPEGTAYKVVYNVGVGQASLPDQDISGLGKDGEYKSEGFDDADVKVEFKIDVGVGKFSLNYY